ncbi:ABC transporter ATP-binding protein [Candidatus Curtissbacteria bacterium]|nr:ABC transporter ATP-binding protein [Candidatus Curtissbacteria bacterium]
MLKEPILKVENLVKLFGTFQALDSISFSIPRGKIIGLLGPNGAGKTTTINILLGITLQNSGSIKYFGKNFSENRQFCLQKINFTSSFNTLQSRISVRENLIVFAHLYEVTNPEKKIKELTSYFEIEDLINQKFNDLSAGQKTRVNITKALINDPEIILMDEPTASLDPDIADKTLSLIEDLKKDKKLSILYTSHNMSEVTRICDQVIFLDRGKIVAQDTPLGLTKRIQKSQLRLTFDGNKNKLEKYLNSQKLHFSFAKNNVVVVNTPEKQIPKIIFGIANEGIWITDIEIKKPTLEDFFLQMARGKNVD